MKISSINVEFFFFFCNYYRQENYNKKMPLKTRYNLFLKSPEDHLLLEAVATVLEADHVELPEN